MEEKGNEEWEDLEDSYDPDNFEECNQEEWEKAFKDKNISPDVYSLEVIRRRMEGVPGVFKVDISDLGPSMHETYKTEEETKRVMRKVVGKMERGMKLGSLKLEDCQKEVEGFMVALNKSGIIIEEVIWGDKEKESITGYTSGFSNNRLVELLISVKAGCVEFQRMGGKKSEFWEIHKALKNIAGNGEYYEMFTFEDYEKAKHRTLKLTIDDNNASAKIIAKTNSDKIDGEFDKKMRGRYERHRADEIATLAGAVFDNQKAFLESNDLQRVCWKIVMDDNEMNLEIRRNAIKILADIGECAERTGFHNFRKFARCEFYKEKVKQLKSMNGTGIMRYQVRRLLRKMIVEK